MKVDEYVTTLLEQISNKKARYDIEREIRQHIECQVDECMEAGMSEEDAVEFAVRDMGDPVVAGVELNRIHRPKMAWGMLSVIILVSLLALVMKILFFRDGFSEPVRYLDGSENIKVEIIRTLIGITFMIVINYLDYSIIGKYSRMIMIGIIAILLLLGLNPDNIDYYGHIYYLNIFGNFVNPRFLLLAIIPVFGGILYTYRYGKDKDILKCFIWMLIPCIVTYIYINSTIFAITFFMIEMLILLIVICRGWFKVSVKKWIMIISGVVVTIITSVLGISYLYGGFRKNMILAWLSPEKYKYDSGYLIFRVRTMMQNSLFIGDSKQENILDFFKIHSRDYVLLFTSVRYGRLITYLLAGLTLLVIGLLFVGVLRQKNKLGRIMGISCCTVFLIRIILYFLTNIGLLFSNVFDCPFWGTGSVTQVLLDYFLLGILLSIYRYKNVLPECGLVPDTAKFVAERQA
ncbi:MAG: permease prefix domain 1-containing protein [Lachnospiraceae bacterium]